VFLNILVAYDGSPSAKVAFEQAVDLARAQGSTVTVLTVAPRVSGYAALSGASPERLKEDAEAWAIGKAKEAVAAAPDDVLVHWLVRSGHVGEEIVNESVRGAHDLIVLGSRGRGRVESEVLGSVNGYVHFHAAVPLLSIGFEPG
jgi:nucleotide-binding universal stress UspA family protein